MVPTDVISKWKDEWDNLYLLHVCEDFPPYAIVFLSLPSSACSRGFRCVYIHIYTYIYTHFLCPMFSLDIGVYIHTHTYIHGTEGVGDRDKYRDRNSHICGRSHTERTTELLILLLLILLQLLRKERNKEMGGE
jgi:hypothetical protein